MSLVKDNQQRKTSYFKIGYAYFPGKLRYSRKRILYFSILNPSLTFSGFLVWFKDVVSTKYDRGHGKIRIVGLAYHNVVAFDKDNIF